MSTPTTDTWITYDEAVERYPWSRRTLGRMTAAGEVRTRRAHRRAPWVYLAAEDLDRLAGEGR